MDLPEHLRLDSPIETLASTDTVEQRGKRALAAIGAHPIFADEHDLAGYRHSAFRKIDAHVLHGHPIETFALGEALAVYFEVFERTAHEDYMADRLTHRQYATRVTRLRNRVIKAGAA